MKNIFKFNLMLLFGISSTFCCTLPIISCSYEPKNQVPENLKIIKAQISNSNVNNNYNWCYKILLYGSNISYTPIYMNDLKKDFDNFKALKYPPIINISPMNITDFNIANEGMIVPQLFSLLDNNTNQATNILVFYSNKDLTNQNFNIKITINGADVIFTNDFLNRI